MTGIRNTDTPVVILQSGLGALAIARTLGCHGIDIHLVTDNPEHPSCRSNYLTSVIVHALSESEHSALLSLMLKLARDMHAKPVLIATSDETAIFVADHFKDLAPAFLIGQNGGELVRHLADKQSMFRVAHEQDVLAPQTYLPKSLGEAVEYAGRTGYPLMLKGVMGNKLFQRTGRKMYVVHDEEELIREYKYMEDPDDLNLMIQELIPGGDDEVYIFNGYFDNRSDCRVGFTGRKIRQYPIHVGCASLGECCAVQSLHDLTVGFMKRIGYTGILDIGYRKDPRDGEFKVLDINPRVGQAFRLFVDENDMDVVKAMYLDLTGQDIPTSPGGIEGRRWVIEDFDIVSFVHYRQEGSLGTVEWLRSFRQLEESAWFDWKDPLPFVLMLGALTSKSLRWVWKKLSFAS